MTHYGLDKNMSLYSCWIQYNSSLCLCVLRRFFYILRETVMRGQVDGSKELISPGSARLWERRISWVPCIIVRAKCRVRNPHNQLLKMLPRRNMCSGTDSGVCARLSGSVEFHKRCNIRKFLSRTYLAENNFASMNNAERIWVCSGKYTLKKIICRHLC